MITLIGILFFTALILIPSYALPEIINIQKISCENQYGPCSQSLVDSLQILNNQNINKVQKDLDNTLADDIRVTQYATQYQFPNEMKVFLVERKPKYSVRSETQLGILQVSENGQVLGISEVTNLPTVIITGSLANIGENIDKEILFSLNFVNFI